MRSDLLPWKNYLTITTEVILMFCLSTFSLGMYVIHDGASFIYSLILMILLYVLVVGLCVQRIAVRFSIAALMIIIPIVPLIVLMLIISLVPILQMLK
jgi:hypothetical protein